MGEAGPPRRGRMGRRAVLRVAAAVPLLPALAGCAGLRGSVRVAVPWSGWELARFRDVLDGFTASTGIDTEVVALGEDIVALLGAKASGAPDVVMMPRPGLVDDHEDQLEAVDFAWQPPAQFSNAWRDVVRVHGRVLGVPFKAANKSVLWYRKDMLKSPPGTWPDWMEACQGLIDDGRPPLALGAADGWPLTDLFENILLALDPSVYRALTGDAPPWRHYSVHLALTRLGELLSKDGVLAGGTDRALITQFEDSLLQVFKHGEAAMVVAPDFAYPVLKRYAQLDGNVGLAPFPGLGELGSEIVAGGDIAVLRSPGSDGGRALITWLARKEAAERWAGYGGFLAPHQGVPSSAYPDGRLAELAGKLSAGFQFDLSDELGGRGAVLLRALQDFLAGVGGGRHDRVDHEVRTVVGLLA
jgi:alpha-glucoside transport system substrate-binding protein